MAPDTAWWVQREFGDHGRFEDDVFVTSYASLPLLASWVLRQDGRARPIEPDELRRVVGSALRKVREVHEGTPPEPAATKTRRARDDEGDRPAGPGRAGALRPAPGAARVSARALRRRAVSRDPGTRARRELPHPGGPAPGPPRAPLARQLRRRLLRGLRRAAGRRRPSRQGALRRHVPRGAAADPARGARDHARARVRRPDDRGGGAQPAREGAPQARGDLRPVRALAAPRGARRRRRGGPRQDAEPGDPRAAPRRDRVPEGGRGDVDEATRRAVRPRARAAELARARVGSLARRGTQLPARPDAHGQADEGALRAT